MLLIERQRLIDEDFAHNVKLLQHYPESDVLKIISRADSLLAREAHLRKHYEFLKTGRR